MEKKKKKCPVCGSSKTNINKNKLHCERCGYINDNQK